MPLFRICSCYAFLSHCSRCLNYLKLGPYDAKRGGLDNPTTNQRFYRIDHGMLQDKTHLFQRKELS